MSNFAIILTRIFKQRAGNIERICRIETVLHSNHFHIHRLLRTDNTDDNMEGEPACCKYRWVLYIILVCYVLVPISVSGKNSENNK